MIFGKLMSNNVNFKNINSQMPNVDSKKINFNIGEKGHFSAYYMTKK
jgi:hypothetical protein